MRYHNKDTDVEALKARTAPPPPGRPTPFYNRFYKQPAGEFLTDQQFENMEKELADKEIILIHYIAEGMYTGTVKLPELIESLRTHVKLFTRPIMKLLDNARAEIDLWKGRAQSVLQQMEAYEAAGIKLEQRLAEAEEWKALAADKMKEQAGMISERNEVISSLRNTINLKNSALTAASKDLVDARKEVEKIVEYVNKNLMPADGPRFQWIMPKGLTDEPRDAAAVDNPDLPRVRDGAEVSVDYKKMWQNEAQMRANLGAENARLHGLIETLRISFQGKEDTIAKKSSVIREQRSGIDSLETELESWKRQAIRLERICEARRMMIEDLQRYLEWQRDELELLAKIRKAQASVIENLRKDHPRFQVNL